MKIYTKSGDTGETSLFDNSRVSKADARVDAYGEVDELNAALGVAAASPVDADLAQVIAPIQRDLFALGARLADPSSRIAGRVTKAVVAPSDIERLERTIDRLEGELPPLRSFILPGGDPAIAGLHVARVTVRRAERTTWAALQTHEDMNPLTAQYLNRLSDLLFILCRVAHAGSEILWKPGGTR